MNKSENKKQTVTGLNILNGNSITANFSTKAIKKSPPPSVGLMNRLKHLQP